MTCFPVRSLRKGCRQQRRRQAGTRRGRLGGLCACGSRLPLFWDLSASRWAGELRCSMRQHTAATSLLLQDRQAVPERKQGRLAPRACAALDPQPHAASLTHLGVHRHELQQQGGGQSAESGKGRKLRPCREAMPRGVKAEPMRTPDEHIVADCGTRGSHKAILCTHRCHDATLPPPVPSACVPCQRCRWLAWEGENTAASILRARSCRSRQEGTACFSRANSSLSIYHWG